MGCELVSDSFSNNDGAVANNKASAPFAYTKIFEEHFPYYLSIGMTYDQFWHGDPMLTKYYRKADDMRQERLNQELWLNGLYIYNAVGALAPILNAFSKQTHANSYLEQPLPRTQAEIDERNRIEQERKQQAFLQALQTSLDMKAKQRKDAEKDNENKNANEKADDEIDGNNC